MAARIWADLVAVGRVAKPQGRKGEVAVVPLSDRPSRFASLRQVYLPAPGGGARLLAVESTWPHKGGFVVKLAGVDDIDQAELLRGQELRVGEEELEPLPEGSYWHHQIKGLDVVDGGGRSLGRAADILETGAEAAVLIVRDAAGVETLIPLVDTFVRQVDLEGGRIVVSPPEYVDAGH
jgi:16S rRNA processing protein RimM